MESTDFTPIGPLCLHSLDQDPIAHKGRVIQGSWQWVINHKLVAAAPLKPGEERIIKTGRGQIYRADNGQTYWELFPTDPSEWTKVVPESYFQEYFAFVGNIIDLKLYRKKKAQRAMQFFPTIEVPRLFVHPDNLPEDQHPYEMSEGDWLVNLDASYYYWKQAWAKRWIVIVDAMYQHNDCLIIDPTIRHEWITRAQAVYGERVQPSQSTQVTILRDGQDCTDQALIRSETDAVIAPWLVTTNLQLVCLRQLAPEEYYRVRTPYGTILESSHGGTHYLVWPPNNPRDMRILDQGAADNYHPVGRHGGFGMLWRKIVPTIAFQVTSEQFPQGIRVVSKETPNDEAPLLVPGDYVVYDGNGGFYHWKKDWAEKNIEIITA